MIQGNILSQTIVVIHVNKRATKTNVIEDIVVKLTMMNISVHYALSQYSFFFLKLKVDVIVALLRYTKFRRLKSSSWSLHVFIKMEAS